MLTSYQSESQHSGVIATAAATALEIPTTGNLVWKWQFNLTLTWIKWVFYPHFFFQETEGLWGVHWDYLLYSASGEGCLYSQWFQFKIIIYRHYIELWEFKYLNVFLTKVKSQSNTSLPPIYLQWSLLIIKINHRNSYIPLCSQYRCCS